MYNFPQGFYTDVRIEDVYQTTINFQKDKMRDCRERSYSAAFIRMYNGSRWFYASTSEVEEIQKEIDHLAELAEPNNEIADNPIVKKMPTTKGKFSKFSDSTIKNINLEDKIGLMKNYFHLFQDKDIIKMWNAFYTDKHLIKTIYSSKGTDLKFDFQICGFSYSFNLAENEKMFSENFKKASNYYSELKVPETEIEDYLAKCIHYLKNSKHVEPGDYEVVLSPIVAGVFAHESFGHKSEADFMIGDENMKKEWALGKEVGSDILSIIDDGNELGSGYVPYDDDGGLENDPEFGSSGFDFLPGGYRSIGSGSFDTLGNYGNFWSAIEYSPDNAWLRMLNYNNTQVGRNYGGKHFGFSVRCVRNLNDKKGVNNGSK